MQIFESEKYKLAYQVIEFTNKHLFLTGKAGTGKTTFLQYLRQRTLKRHVVLAPTGVAAINAHGVTIHSFFQLPLRIFIPEEFNNSNKIFFQLTRQKQDIIRNLDMIIIDEISMVRADIIDAMDFILRYVRGNNLPFGGIQLLMIGDLHQLPPVIRRNEKNILSLYYASPFFFESLVFKRTEYVTIELDKIFRQEDSDFIRILNKVREGVYDDEVYQILNARYIPDFDQNKYENYILLTTHNSNAFHVNKSKLEELDTPAWVYNAQIKGDFAPELFPTEAELTLKVNAQVMFIRNDSDEDKRFYNGKIGKITELNEDSAMVHTEDNLLIKVEPVEWENIRYTLDEEHKTVKEEIIGTFTQLPLKLAWAITIHKSQGLTFEKVAIDALNAFEHGQVYVALSRCKSLSGLVLINPLYNHSIKINTQIKTQRQKALFPNEEFLNNARNEYVLQLLNELFTFDEVEVNLITLLNILNKNETSDNKNIIECLHFFENNIKNYSQIFRKVIKQKIHENDLKHNNYLQERIKKASMYFIQKISHLTNMLIQQENHSNSVLSEKKSNNTYKRLLKALAKKKFCFENIKEGFTIEKYLKVRQTEVNNLDSHSGLYKMHKRQDIKALPFPILYKKIYEWSKQKASIWNLKQPLLSNEEILKIINNISQNGSSTFEKYINLKNKEYKKEIINIIKEFLDSNKL